MKFVRSLQDQDSSQSIVPLDTSDLQNQSELISRNTQMICSRGGPETEDRELEDSFVV